MLEVTITRFENTEDIFSERRQHNYPTQSNDIPTSQWNQRNHYQRPNQKLHHRQHQRWSGTSFQCSNYLFQPSLMSSTAKESSVKFVTNESTLTDVSKSTSSGQRSPTVFTPIPFHTRHGVTGGTPLDTTMVTQTSTTAVVSPEKPKATPRSAAIAENDISIVCSVVVKLETAVNLLMENMLSQVKNAS